MLTGKAKEDFNKWFIKHSNDFGTVITASSYGGEWLIDLEELYDELPENLQNTIIIEWFDSVGIYINPTLRMPKEVNKWAFIVDFELHENSLFKTRQQATEEAIKKANELYNTTQ